MSGKTGIQWTDATWNPVRGCSRISPGCQFCYAEAVAARFSKPGQPYHGLAKMTPRGPQWTGDVRFVPKHIKDPIRWKKPRMIFVNSMSDLFHEKLGTDVLQSVFDVMFEAKHHIYQVLTKRSQRMMELLPHLRYPGGQKWMDRPERHIWMGVSVETQFEEERIEHLVQTPAAVRFLSLEPLLQPIDLSKWLIRDADCPTCRGARVDTCDDPGCPCDGHMHTGEVCGWRGHRRKIHWVIVGGESGPRARRMQLDWVRTIVAQCKEKGVPVFVKQLGSKPQSGWKSRQQPNCGCREAGCPHLLMALPIVMKLKDGHGGDPEEWPEDLRVREFPEHQLGVGATC